MNIGDLRQRDPYLTQIFDLAFSEEQINAVRKESEAGVETGELCRRHAITRPCFYQWKSKFDELEGTRERNATRRASWPLRQPAQSLLPLEDS